MATIKRDFLLKALSLAQLRRGFCAPNPAVGCVVVKDGNIIAEGMHWAPGSPHAEADALAKAGKQAVASTCYVTLEPCSHWGRTPPCTKSIIDSGIKQVVFAYRDPNKSVKGSGALALEQAGIEVIFEPQAEIDIFYQSYAYWCQFKRPFLTAKLALSLDGKIAGELGKPVKLTNEAIDRFTHFNRQHTDAILTTAKTISCDDPRFSARLDQNTIKKNLYIIDRENSLDPKAKLFLHTENVFVFHDSNKAPTKAHPRVEYIAVPSCCNLLDLAKVMDVMGEHGIHDVWVEAGGRCFSYLLENQLINRAYLYLVPKILGELAYPGFCSSLDLMKGVSDLTWSSYENDMLLKLEY